MDQHFSIPYSNQLISIPHDLHQLNEQLLCLHAKGPMVNSSVLNPQVSISSHHACTTSSKCHQPVHDSDKTRSVHSTTTLFSAMNRHLSMPSYDQHRFVEEETPLRIHVGNIPFLWTVDDLCKQFLVFGPIKDPEIVSNERGSKGFGFITFLRQGDGMNAIRVKNGSIADGRKITVALASSRSSTRINGSHCHCCSLNNNLAN